MVRVRATVSDDLRTITGTMELSADESVWLVDPLPQLPTPDDDVLRRRTFPGPVEQGLAHHTPLTAGSTWFSTVVPDRYGASGRVPGRGLFMNGLWHPQPVDHNGVAVVEWDVEITLPDHTVGVVNGQVGTHTVRWSGEADRIALAVVLEGRVVPVETTVGEVVLVERGPQRARRHARVTEAVQTAWQGPGAPHLVVVDTPSRRRLTRVGPGTLFLSDRAFRVSLGLWRYHLPVVQHGVLAAGLPIADPYSRDIAAAALAEEVRPDGNVEDLLGVFRWIPEIDALLYDGRLPFYSDVFTEVWPGDPVADDLAEVVAPTTPGRAVCTRVDSEHGPGTCAELGWGLAKGRTLADAAERAKVDPAQLEQWRRRPAPQSLSLSVADDASVAVVTRSQAEASEAGVVARAGAELISEPVVLDIDGERHTWVAPAGPGEWQVALPDDTEAVTLDPDHTLLQDTRVDDRWPSRWVPVFAFFPTELAITNRRFSGSASVALRKQYSTRWVWLGEVSRDPVNAVAVDVGGYRSFGPLQDRRSRPYMVWFGGGPALLDTRYRPVDGLATALGVYAGASWDTRVDPIFPRSGHRLAVGTTGGVVPGGERWGSVGGQAKGVVGRGRVAAVGSLSGTWASGGVLHRLPALGGGGALQALPAQAVVGQRRALVKTELRWEAVRYASVPGPLVWLSNVQLAGGLEAGTLASDGPGCVAAGPCRTDALGWTAGLVLTGDVAGVRPTLLGATVAGPLALSDPDLAPSYPQLYVRLTQPF